MTENRTVLLDIEAIARRAENAPGGDWVQVGDQVRVPWTAPGDAGYDTDDYWMAFLDSGRYLTIADSDWIDCGNITPPGLMEFLEHSRQDVLALAAEVRRLRGLLAPGLAPGPAVGARHCPICQVGWAGPAWSCCWIDDRHPGKDGRVIGLGLKPAALTAPTADNEQEN